MYEFNGEDITLTKGDSLSFNITYTGRVLPATADILFSVKKRTSDTEPIIEKTVHPVQNVASVHILPEDTAEMKAGTYFWDARIVVRDDDVTEVRTPMSYAAFQLLEVIGNVD